MSREKVTCRGSLALGSGCGHCERCEQERARMRPPSLAKLCAKVDAWNETNKIGTRVEYRKDDDSILRTATRSPAQILSGHTAVVWLTGVAGCVDLDRVKPVRRDYKTTELEGKVKSLNLVTPPKPRAS